MRAFWFLALVTTSSLLAGRANADFLADYLDDKTFGIEPGPCPGPTKNDDVCTGDWENLPPLAKEMEICLGDGICGKLGDLIESGVFTVWQLQCKNLEIADITMSHLVQDSDRLLSGSVSVEDIRMTCTGWIRIEDLKITLEGIGVIVTFEGEFTLDQSTLAEGISLDLGLEFRTDPSESLNEELPEELTIPYDQCLLEPNLGLELVSGSDGIEDLIVCLNTWCPVNFGLILGPGFTDIILALIIDVAEAVVSGIVCQLAEEAAVLGETGEPGPLGDALLQIKDQVDEWGLSEGQDVNLADLDASILATSPYTQVTQTELDNAIDFNASAAVEAVAVALNGWLGAPSDQPQYAPRPVVNELIDLVTDPAGSLAIDLVDLDAALEISIPLNVTNATVRLEYVQVVGLSTISTFEILDLGVEEPVDERLRRTFNNTLGIDEVSLQVRAYLQLERGDWVTESCQYPPPRNLCTSDASAFTFTFEVTVTDLFFETSVLAVVDPDQLSDLEVGQLIDVDFADEPFGAFSNALRCVSPAAYALNVTNLRASLGAIQNPKLIDFDGDGLSQLVTDAIELGTDLVKGALKTKFPGIANGPIRELVNEVLLEDVTLFGREAGTVCNPWRGPSGEGTYYVDFGGAAFSPVYALVNEGIGGDPIRDTDVDLNELLRTVLEYNEDTYPDFPLTSEGLDEGSWRLTDEYDSIGRFSAYATDDYLSFTDLTIGNLTSLYKLLLEESQVEGLNIGFGFGGAMEGGPVQPLSVAIQLRADVTTRDILEQAELKLVFNQMDFEMELTRFGISTDYLYGLTVTELQNIPCILAVLREFEFREVARMASAASISFEVTTLPSGSVGSNKVSEALQLLETEQPQERARALVNTLLDVGFNAVLESIEFVPQLQEVTSTLCAASDPLSDLLDNIPLSDFLPNVTAIVERCTGPILPLPSLQESENLVFPDEIPEEAINLQESATIELVRQGLGVLQGDTLAKVLTSLANSSGSALADLFELENPDDPEDGNATLALPLDFLGLELDFMDDFSPGFRAGVNSLRIVGFSRMLQSFSLLEPVSSLITRNRITFREDEAVEIIVGASLELAGEAVGEPVGSVVREDVNVSLFIQDINLVFDLVSAVDSSVVSNLTLSQFLQVDGDQVVSLSDHVIGCLLSAVYRNGLFLHSLELTLGTLAGVSLTSTQEILSEGMEKLLDAVVDITTYFYAEVTTNVFQNCVREYVNSALFATQSLLSCPPASSIAPPPLEGDDRILRLSTSELLNGFLSFWFDVVVPESYLSVNAAINAALDNLVFFDSTPRASGESDSFFQEIPLVYNGVQYGIVEVGLEDMTVRQLGTFTDLRPLVPMDSDGTPLYASSRSAYVNPRASATVPSAAQIPYTTRTNIMVSGPVEVSAKLTLNADGLFRDIPNMVNELQVTVAVSDVTIGLELVLMVDLVDLLQVQVKSFETLEQLPCALVPIKGLEPLDFNLSASDLGLTVGCAGTCDFPLINYLEDGRVFTNTNGDEISELFNTFIEYANGYLTTQGAQELIDAALSRTSDDCASVAAVAEDLLTFGELEKDDVATLFAYIFLGGCGVAAIAAACLVPLHRRRERDHKARKLAGVAPVDRDAELAGEMALLELRTSSLFQHPVTPPVARFLVPFVQIMNVVGLVIAIGFSDAANITLSATLFGATTQTVALVPFTLFSTINDTWNSGAWPLALLITVASCMWPIVKNLVLLFLWFAPTTIVGAERRHTVLEYLDMLGKWSFLDVFVIVITLAALRNYVVGAYWTSLSFLEDEVFITDINVTPENGLTLLCFVAALSLVINHVVIFFNNKVHASNRESEARAHGNEALLHKIPVLATHKVRVMSYRFAGTTASGQQRVVAPRAARALLGLLGMAFLFIIVGITLPLITFDLRGLLGLLLELVSEGSPRLASQLNLKTYSVLSMGAALGESPTDSTWEAVVITFFKMLYAISVYVGPLLLIVLLFALMVVPMDLGTGQGLFFWTKINSYWSGLEIYLVAIILTLLELGIVTQFITDFITNDVCSQAKAAIELAVADPDTNGVCFTIYSYLEPTAVVLFLGLFFQLVAFYIVTVIASAALADRNYAAYRNVHNDAKPKPMSRLNRWILRHCTQFESAALPSRATSRTAPDQGPFTLLDDESAFVDRPSGSGVCGGLSKWCCDFEKGQRSADARIAAWQKRFEVAGTVAESSASDDIQV
ncbi:Hypothetical Protein FCC1311_085612 [Hondaea fermentalgiana]|uniref:Uncharacterized protein n=1 Tax=Hondaea fermentalgiana TaxID=2315210 RepID=A0A2R5GN65_9STRA|nr:Hypothetical Protein FCC1311_085612 [Hondaea fermentalgiana]|eukprot:GBG32336.1 Hypothetical Protein FCC1311_085612 [Hondaea fermentalgiana]